MATIPSSVEQAVELQESIERHARYSLGKAWGDLSASNRFAAVALMVRDRLLDRHLETEDLYKQKDAKRLYYLSIEFLIGQIAGKQSAQPWNSRSLAGKP